MGVLLDLLLQPEKIYFEIFKDSGADTFPLPDKTEKEMLRADIVVPKTESLLTAQSDDVLYSIRKISFHYILYR